MIKIPIAYVLNNKKNWDVGGGDSFSQTKTCDIEIAPLNQSLRFHRNLTAPSLGPTAHEIPAARYLLSKYAKATRIQNAPL